MKIKIKNRYNFFFGIIIFAALAMYGALMIGTDVWYDEAYTFATIRHGFVDICRITAADVHPPLYYILLKIFTLPFSDKLFWSKIFSMIPMLIILSAGGLSLKRIFNEKVSLCFMGIFLIFPFMTPYAVEIRMYSLAAMFVFFTAMYAYNGYESGAKKDLVLLVVFGVSAAYTHYFALVSVGVIYMLLLAAILKHKRKLLKKWLLCAAFSVAGYLPWIGCFISQLAFKIHNEYWIEPITADTLLSYLKDTFASGHSKVLISFMEMTFALLFINVIFSGGKKEKQISVLAVLVWLLTIMAGIIVSVAVRPIFVIRYSVPAIPVLLVFAAVALAGMQPREFKAAAALVILISGVNNYVTILSRECEYWDIGFRDEFADRYSYADCYIIDDEDDDIKTEHYKGVLAYYEHDKPIYSYQPVTTAVPFDNVCPIEDFDTDENETVILLKHWSTPIPAELLEKYTYSYSGKVATDSYFSTMDIYKLIRK